MSSFAKAISSSPIEAASARQSFDTARQSDAQASERRESEMVAKDQPKPNLRPSPDLALGPDGAAFNAAWEREQRRAAFIQERTDPATGGHVRTLRKNFHR